MEKPKKTAIKKGAASADPKAAKNEALAQKRTTDEAP